MLSTVMLLLKSSLLFSLHLAGNSGSFPRPLSADEEQEYLQRFAGGDIQARNKLVEHNMRLVAHIIKKYYNPSVEQDDLISIGTIGLIKGISSYRADKNVRLATYAARCIENAILSRMRLSAGKKQCYAKSICAGGYSSSFRRIFTSCADMRTAMCGMLRYISMPSG